MHSLEFFRQHVYFKPGNKFPDTLKNIDLIELQCINKYTRANSGGQIVTQIKEIWNPLTVRGKAYSVEQPL